MTEDDTFAALRRPSVHEMVGLHKDWRQNHVVHCGFENLAWAEKYHWKWGEYLRARKAAGYDYDDRR